MNSSNYGHHREWSRLLSLRGCWIITHSRWLMTCKIGPRTHIYSWKHNRFRPETSRRLILEILKNTGERIKARGATPCPRGWGRAPCLVGPLVLHRPQLQPHIFTFGRKNQGEGFITFYNTEPPPSPKLSREGWSGVHSGLQRGESVAIVIINHPPSPISWCSPPCMSNSVTSLVLTMSSACIRVLHHV